VSSSTLMHRNRYPAIVTITLLLSAVLFNASLIRSGATLPPTRTPGTPAQCPRPTDQAAKVTGAFFDSAGQPLPAPILNYLNGHGAPDGLKAALQANVDVGKGVQVIGADVTGDRRKRSKMGAK
jgi:hypothetical protein